MKKTPATAAAIIMEMFYVTYFIYAPDNEGHNTQH